MGEWFDIETAPKDATPILIIGNDLRLDCLSYCAAFWGAGAWHNDIDGSVFPEYYEPTHWQPLPEPPNQLKGTELIMKEQTGVFILPVCEKQIGRWLVKKGFEVIYPKNSILVAKDPVLEEWMVMMDAVATVIAREESQPQ